MNRFDWPEKTIREASEMLASVLDEGAHCPLCGQWAKRYKRKINSTMARSLLWIVSRSDHSSLEGGWINIPAEAPKWLTRSNQHTTLRWWGLIERLPNDEPAKKHSGVWRPTQRGIEFSRGTIQVPSYVIHYNNKMLHWSDEKTTIQEALGEKFDYSETMEPVGFNPEEKAK